MATASTVLISRIILSGAQAPDILEEVLEFGITDEDHINPANRSMFSLMRSYVQQHVTTGSVMGPVMVKERFPNFELFDDPGMTVKSICMEVRKDRLTRDIQRIVTEAAHQATFDPLKAAEALRNVSTNILQLGYGQTTDIPFDSVVDQMGMDYELAKKGLNMGPVSWPWGELNEKTRGIQKDDFIVFYGRPKSMKSFILAYMVAMQYLMGHRILVYTKEMSPQSLFNRIICFMCNLPYTAYHNGTLTPEEEAAFVTMRAAIKEEKERTGESRLVILSGRDAPAGGDSVSWFHAKCRAFKPHAAYVDGFYLMAGEGGKKEADWLRVTNISRALRQVSLDLSHPIIATTQANRKAASNSDANSEEIGYSDAIAQDATFFARCVKEERVDENMEPDDRLVLAVGGSREYSLKGIRIHAKPCSNFFFEAFLSDRDIEKAKEMDAKNAAKEAELKEHTKTRSSKKKKETEEPDATEVAMQAQLNGIS